MTERNLIFRSDSVDEDQQFGLEREATWHLFNDYHRLNKRQIANVLYFNMTRPEFDQISGPAELREGVTGKGDFALNKRTAMAELEAKMRQSYKNSGEFTMRVTVSVFAGFVFLLPIILNYLA